VTGTQIVGNAAVVELQFSSERAQQFSLSLMQMKLR
jgi:hypothetical protein